MVIISKLNVLQQEWNRPFCSPCLPEMVCSVLLVLGLLEDEERLMELRYDLFKKTKHFWKRFKNSRGS